MSKYSIYNELASRILVLDGGLGTMVQRHGLGEEDYRGERFADWGSPLKGCNDLLVLTRPDIIAGIHEAYLTAGADIISTDSFNATSISLADYGLGDFVYEINRAAATIARSEADRFTLRNPSKPRFVAGSMGPTNRTSSLSANVDDPSAREVTFEQLAEAYREQARGLLDGGADVLLVETIFDTLNAKAALFAIEGLREETGRAIPIMASGTIADTSGRTLSGQTVEAFYTSLSHGNLLSVGLNCAFGARQMLPYLERLVRVAECRISTHPNAGLPNISGGYDETPQMFADTIEEYLRRGLVNIVGGCCGTTPEHTRLLAQLATKYTPRPLPEKKHLTVLSGLEPLAITPENNFINIGERANVAGSAKFARLIREGRYDEAVAVARDQVADGAQVVDVCMDDGMIDGAAAMTRFLNMAATEPELARVPLVIDSSRWEVLEAGLRCVQGKSVVNSISLKEGEAEFLRRAHLVRRLGAAAVVMLFDERGQADTFERKIEVAERAYNLLTESGFPPEEIIFDPNVLSIATGIAEHNNYAVDFIEATRWIKQNLPHARVSAGVSNLSFAFRGNNRVREAMHSVFLYHAIAAGLDMGIVNAGMLQIYSEIEPHLLELVEDVVLNRREDATERLADYAEQLKNVGVETKPTDNKPDWRALPLAERITHAMLKGLDEHAAEDALEALRELGSPLEVIDRILMPAMGEVGELFGEGKMFLPQVVKSARVMRRAVDALAPYIKGSAGAGKAGRVVLATVKGDVHDIGKNIVSVVISCNGYEVVDLGVMVPAERIIDEAVAHGASAICLSGLITPSLEEMIGVVRELERRGLTIPVIVGGATTSRLHTAVKIAPEYGGVVVHSRDASDNAGILSRLLGADREQFIAQVQAEQAAERELYATRIENRSSVPLEVARHNRYVKDPEQITLPQHTGRVVFSDFPIEQVEPYIDWTYLFAAWNVKGSYPQILNSPEKGAEARKLFEDAQGLLAQIKEKQLLRLEGVAGIFPARADGDDIVVTDPKGRDVRLPQLRNQSPDSEHNLSVADYVTAGDDDYIGAFAVTAGVGLAELTEKFRTEGDEYNAIMAKLLADRLTEAFAEAVHEFVRRVSWGYQAEEIAPDDAIRGRYQGLRYAFGYPATPDHSLKKEVFDLLAVPQTTAMRLTDNYMIAPGEALCGLIVADPKATYFTLGTLGDDQITDYARRRGKTPAEIQKLIAKL
ncbi:MAG: methionine synthase [Rikenellaceae bacterium]|jgi:5-methyltetrahydrofolate--homocysteine methyltransferase|nr:methionine synthase [Rikenellaceae bacterium]